MFQFARLLILVLGLSTQAFASADVPSLNGLDDADIMKKTAFIFPHYVQKIVEDKWGELGEHFSTNMEIIQGVFGRSAQPKKRSSEEQTDFRNFESHIAIMTYVMQQKAMQLQKDTEFQSKLANTLATNPDLPDYVKNLPFTLSIMANQFSHSDSSRK